MRSCAGRRGDSSPSTLTCGSMVAPRASATPGRDTDFGAAELTHLNLYDRTVEGLALRDVAACTVQYHPEAGPGPHDARYLFDRFLELAA